MYDTYPANQQAAIMPSLHHVSSPPAGHYAWGIQFFAQCQELGSHSAFAGALQATAAETHRPLAGSEDGKHAPLKLVAVAMIIDSLDAASCSKSAQRRLYFGLSIETLSIDAEL